jgi:nucleoside-diphosphate-sugar epimerase
VHVHGLEAVVLRYFNVFGLRQDLNSQYSVAIPLFIAMALEGCSPTINGDGEQTRDFTHVENVIEVNLMSADVAPDRVSGQVFNVGAGERTSPRPAQPPATRCEYLWPKAMRSMAAALGRTY